MSNSETAIATVTGPRTIPDAPNAARPPITEKKIRSVWRRSLVPTRTGPRKLSIGCTMRIPQPVRRSDRRNDAENFQVERYCASSANSGALWQEQRVTGTQFPPIHGTDDLIDPNYMGDYDGLATDFTRSTPGFLGAFQVMTSGMN